MKNKAIMIISCIWCAYQLFIALRPDVLSLTTQRVFHLMFALILVWLIKDGLFKNKWLHGGSTAVLLIFSIGISLYMAANATRFEMRPFGYSVLDNFIAIAGVIILLEATRRVMGWSLVIVVGAFILYALYGNFLPGLFGTRGVDVLSLAQQLFFTIDGVYGQILDISATLIFVYLLFGGFLLAFGGGEFFTNLAHAMVGTSRGGAAKVAVIGSAFFGSISGSAISNVVTVGSITIPLMKKTGFKPEFAGAVETVASVGGQILPPVMGATAFVMADMMRVPYVSVVAAAAIPALLYYVALLFMVDFEAAKLGIKGMDRKDLPRVRDVLKEGWSFIIPFAVMIYLLLVQRWEAQTVGLVSIGSLILIEIIKRPRIETFKRIVRAFVQGTRSAMGVAIPCATVGIIVGVVLKTGLGISFAGALRNLAGDNILLMLVIMMIASLILGMGLPTTAAYVMLAVMIVPALIDMGVPAMAAHMFALYFGVLADVTPPVCLSAYTAAGIAGAHPDKTGMRAFTLSYSGFIVPFIFIFQPGLLLLGTPMEIALAIVSSLIAVLCLSGVVQNFFFVKINLFIRIVLFASACCMIFPNFRLYGGLLACFLIVYVVYQLQKSKKKLPEPVLPEQQSEAR